MDRGNRHHSKNDESMRSLSCLTLIGLTRVNLCMKTGPTILSKAMNLKGTINLENIIINRNILITPTSNTRTGEVLINVIVSDNNNYIKMKHGNPGQLQ